MERSGDSSWRRLLTRTRSRLNQFRRCGHVVYLTGHTTSGYGVKPDFAGFRRSIVQDCTACLRKAATLVTDEIRRDFPEFQFCHCTIGDIDINDPLYVSKTEGCRRKSIYVCTRRKANARTRLGIRLGFLTRIPVDFIHKL